MSIKICVCAISAYAYRTYVHGVVWYLVAMTDWTPRDITIDLSRLKGMGTNADIFADGRNSHREATDYRRIVTKFSPTDKLNIHLAPGGGWAARIYF